ncbi:hypothetical protein [Methylophaga lonarensis]|uniref:hypothetical protein n=1 Tax=Methylophaga lonarensis TaxID=999151 RepID=UPI003D2D15AC
MSSRKLIIGGIEILMPASFTLRQIYEPQQAVSRVRMMDGSLTQQTAWRDKLVTEISGDGIAPAGFQLIDWSQPVVIKCIAERAVSSASNVIAVHPSRRADYGVQGRALVGNRFVNTPVSMDGDEATLTPVANAIGYQAYYWPELICYADPPRETRGARNADYGWSLTAEEI